MELIDFSIYPASDVQYGGSERKEAILVPTSECHRALYR